MRLAGTALICVVAAFGAAFLLTRAVDHPAPARAGTISHPVTTPTATTKKTAPNEELRSQFTPLNVALRHKPHHRRSAPKPASHPSAPQYTSPATTTQSAPTPAPQTYTQPAYTQPYVAPSPPSSGSSGGSTHHSGGSGSGTTTIGG